VTFRPYQSEYVDVVLGEQINSWTDLGGGFYSKNFSGLGFDISSVKAIEEGANGLLEFDSLASLQNLSYAPGVNAFYVNDGIQVVYLRLNALTPSDIFFVDIDAEVNVISPYITWQNLTLSYAHQGFDVDWYGVGLIVSMGVIWVT
jgi:hypothetical protein